MKFNIKAARQYSSQLKDITNTIQNSLRTDSRLTTPFSDKDDFSAIPAAQCGLYAVKVTHQKSKLNEVLGKEFDDEVLEINPKSDLAKVDVNTRLQMVRDLIEERTKVDYEIESLKNKETYVDAFTNKAVTYDFGCKINKEYRNFVSEVLSHIVEMDSKVTTTVNGKMQSVNSSDEKNTVTVTYPIEITGESNVKQADVMKDLEEINQKCLENSANLNVIEISKFFDFEPKFNLNPTVRSLIEKYKEEE